MRSSRRASNKRPTATAPENFASRSIRNDGIEPLEIHFLESDPVDHFVARGVLADHR